MKKTIDTAPRDGTLIVISNGCYEGTKWVPNPEMPFDDRMRWVEGKHWPDSTPDTDETTTIGMWESQNGDTWSEEHGNGPTHWEPI